MSGEISPGTKDSINSVVIGMVTDNKDPDGLGRVKVKYPWQGVENQSDWAWIASLYAGNGRGAVFIPEIGDEVLVAFDQGAIDRPVVIGGLWNRKDKPPETNSDGRNNTKMIRSRSGHKIVFSDDRENKNEKIEIRSNGDQSILLDDSASREKIAIKTKTGHTILLDDSAGQEKIEIRTKTGHTILLDDSPGREKIGITDKTGHNRITIDSSRNAISLESQARITIKSAIVEIESTGSLTLKSGGFMTLDSNGILNIQGTLVKIN